MRDGEAAMRGIVLAVICGMSWTAWGQTAPDAIAAIVGIETTIHLAVLCHFRLPVWADQHLASIHQTAVWTASQSGLPAAYVAGAERQAMEAAMASYERYRAVACADLASVEQLRALDALQ